MVEAGGGTWKIKVAMRLPFDEPARFGAWQHSASLSLLLLLLRQ